MKLEQGQKVIVNGTWFGRDCDLLARVLALGGDPDDPKVHVEIEVAGEVEPEHRSRWIPRSAVEPVCEHTGLGTADVVPMHFGDAPLAPPVLVSGPVHREPCACGKRHEITIPPDPHGFSTVPAALTAYQDLVESVRATLGADDEESLATCATRIAESMAATAQSLTQAETRIQELVTERDSWREQHRDLAETAFYGTKILAKLSGVPASTDATVKENLAAGLVHLDNTVTRLRTSEAALAPLQARIATLERERGRVCAELRCDTDCELGSVAQMRMEEGQEHAKQAADLATELAKAKRSAEDALAALSTERGERNLREAEVAEWKRNHAALSETLRVSDAKQKRYREERDRATLELEQARRSEERLADFMLQKPGAFRDLLTMLGAPMGEGKLWDFDGLNRKSRELLERREKLEDDLGTLERALNESRAEILFDVALPFGGHVTLRHLKAPTLLTCPSCGHRFEVRR